MLSLSMIVKNEEPFLAHCLDSVRGLVDEMVILDTGSTDGTLEIARAAGARVFQSPWRDDFSAARNASLEKATGDWILILDADEELPASEHAPLRQVDDASIEAALRQSCYGLASLRELEQATAHAAWRPIGLPAGLGQPGWQGRTCHEQFTTRLQGQAP